MLRYVWCFIVDSGIRPYPEQESAGCQIGILEGFFNGQKTNNCHVRVADHNFPITSLIMVIEIWTCWQNICMKGLGTHCHYRCFITDSKLTVKIKNIHLLHNNMQNYFAVVDVHNLKLTLTLTCQVLKIMTPMVIVFNRIKFVVENDYHIDWSVIAYRYISISCIFPRSIKYFSLFSKNYRSCKHSKQ